MRKKRNIAILFAILAAALYAIHIPVSKAILPHVGSTMMAALLYLGAGIGIMLYGLIERNTIKGKQQDRLTGKELPYTIAMVILDILAPILLMYGIARTNAANVSLLNNFEIVATSIIALVLFNEAISIKLWLVILLVAISSAILSFEGNGAFAFNEGSLLVLGASMCWGFENNCTKKISHKNTEEIVTIKGCFSGLGSFIIALILGEKIPQWNLICLVLLLGFVSYGLSINFYIKAQKELGAAKVSAFYSIAPFLGVLFSMIFLSERPSIQFYIALIIMVISTMILIKDSIR